MSYSGKLYSDFMFVVDKCVSDLTPHSDEFDSIVGTGLSGTTITPIVACMLDKTWAIARKPSEATHSTNIIEGTIGSRYIFLDDFISTGTTLNRVGLAIKTEAECRGLFASEVPRLIATYEYNWRRPVMSWTPRHKLERDPYRNWRADIFGTTTYATPLVERTRDYVGF
jgi:hypothetical protein